MVDHHELFLGKAKLGGCSPQHIHVLPRKTVNRYHKAVTVDGVAKLLRKLDQLL